METHMQHPDEGTIHAWLDGQLRVDEARELETHIGECAECAAAVAEARGLVAAASRILTKLDDVPAGVLPASTAAARPASRAPASSSRRAWWRRREFQAAAGIVAVVGGSWLVWREQPAVKETMQRESTVDARSGFSAPPPASAAPQPAADAAVAKGISPKASVAGPALAKKLAVVPNETAAKAVQNTARVAAAEVLTGTVASSTVGAAAAAGAASAASAASAAVPPAAPAIAAQSAAVGGAANLRGALETRRALADMSMESRRVSRYTPITNIPGLRVISSDTLDDNGPVRRTVYELRPGVSVQLMSAFAGRAIRFTVPSRVGTVGDTTRQALQSIAWESAGVSYLLLGTPSRDELESIRRTIP